jgi:hypothetical protein
MPKAKELQELGQWKVGQYVTINSRYGKSICPITKITDGRGGTIYAGNSKFDERGNLRGGDIWNTETITLATDEDRIEIKGRNAKYRLSEVDWSKLNNSKAIEIEKLLNDNGIKTRKNERKN